MAKRIIQRVCHADLAEEVLGDLEESFAVDLRQGSPRRARRRYWLQALLFIRPHTFGKSRYANPGPIMLKNYLQVSLRFMARHKTYSAINLTGLALGLTVALLISAFVLDENSFDRHLADLDRMYRLVAGQPDEDYEGIAKVNGPYGPTTAEQIPAVEAATRFVFFGQSQAEVDGDRFTLSGGFYADSTTFEVFSWPVLAGDRATALTAPNSLVLTESLARTLFDTTDPMGQSVTIDGDRVFLVTGVMEDIPRTSHFVPAFLASLSGYGHPSHDDWVAWNQYYTYLKLRPGSDPQDVAAAATRVVHANLDDRATRAVGDLRLQPVSDIYLRSDMFRELGPMGDLQTVRILALVAAFILLLAALNFVNLSTARATLRAREVG
ncbi:MAG: ABC transporter permease, partial [Rhodothermales bacterium]|nr:ABC transporter permease [Rhodothermales bacterium]